MIVKLTQDFIDRQLKCPESVSRIEFVSDERTGLYVEVRQASNGYGTYYLRYKDVSNKSCHQKVGRTQDITLAEAKEAVKTLKAEIALGADPRADEKARLAVITLNQFFYEYYLPHAKLNKRTWLRDEQLYSRIDKRFGSNRLNDVSRLELQKFHGNLINEGLAPATANHHIKLAKRMFNLAISWELTTVNPASKIRLYAEDNLIENLLDSEQLNRLVNVLNTEKPKVVCQLLLFLLSTGARFSEAAKSTWTQFDLHNKVWKIPATNSKSKKVRSVPLNDSALAVINALSTKGNHDYLFVNAKTKQPYTTVARSWTQLKKKANLPSNVRIHDMRHNFASLLVNSGVSLYVTQQLLGHATPVVTQRYAHLNVSSLQKASDVASQKILAKPEAKAA
jgi:site-specific recombinase XerD